MWENLLKQSKSLKESISLYIQRKPLNSLIWIVSIILACLIVVMAIWADAFPEWVGFGAYDEASQGARAKTLWDWMELLIVPATLTIGVFLLGKWQAHNEKRKTQDDQRQGMLDTYIDKMAELLIDKKLRDSENIEANVVARTITLTLFRQLDGDRKGNALQFIFETGLIANNKTCIDVLGLDLDKASLAGATLIEAELSGTSWKNSNLKNARFIRSILTGSNFSNSEMQGADFTDAKLDQAILINCNLVNAEFSGADLYMANFTGASVKIEQLKKAKTLEYSILPDGTIY